MSDRRSPTDGRPYANYSAPASVAIPGLSARTVTSSATTLREPASSVMTCADDLEVTAACFWLQVCPWQGPLSSVDFDTGVGADRNMRCDILVSCDEHARSNPLRMRRYHVNASRGVRMRSSERGFQTWNKVITMTLEMKDVRRTFRVVWTGSVVDTGQRVLCVCAVRKSDEQAMDVKDIMGVKRTICDPSESHSGKKP